MKKSSKKKTTRTDLKRQIADLDRPALDTLVLAMPISWKGTLQQYAGRLRQQTLGPALLGGGTDKANGIELQAHL